MAILNNMNFPIIVFREERKDSCMEHFGFQYRYRQGQLLAVHPFFLDLMGVQNPGYSGLFLQFFLSGFSQLFLLLVQEQV